MANLESMRVEAKKELGSVVITPFDAGFAMAAKVLASFVMEFEFADWTAKNLPDRAEAQASEFEDEEALSQRRNPIDFQDSVLFCLASEGKAGSCLFDLLRSVL